MTGKRLEAMVSSWKSGSVESMIILCFALTPVVVARGLSDSPFSHTTRCEASFSKLRSLLKSSHLNILIEGGTEHFLRSIGMTLCLRPAGSSWTGIARSKSVQFEVSHSGDMTSATYRELP